MTETETPAEQPLRLPEHMRSPIDRAVAARNRPGRQPHPDPAQVADTRRVDMPIDHNPDSVRGEGPSAQTARNAMDAIWRTWGVVKTAAEDPGTNLATLGVLSQRALEKGLTSADRAIATIESQIAGIEKEISAAIQPRVTDALATEIRTHWQKVAPKGKSVPSDMMSAVRSDPRTSSAILGAPPYLSGLKDHDLVRGAAIDAHAPEQKAALDEATRALGKITAARDRSMSVLGSRIALWKDPQPTAIRQLQEIADA